MCSPSTPTWLGGGCDACARRLQLTPRAPLATEAPLSAHKYFVCSWSENALCRAVRIGGRGTQYRVSQSSVKRWRLRLEADGVIPTNPLLERISEALDADLILEISPHAA